MCVAARSRELESNVKMNHRAMVIRHIVCSIKTTQNYLNRNDEYERIEWNICGVVDLKPV